MGMKRRTTVDVIREAAAADWPTSKKVPDTKFSLPKRDPGTHMWPSKMCTHATRKTTNISNRSLFHSTLLYIYVERPKFYTEKKIAEAAFSRLRGRPRSSDVPPLSKVTN